jgi:hypothetical protein
MSRVSVALVWAGSRALVLWLLFGSEAWVTGDIAYFADSLARLHDRGIGQTLVEYPLLGVALLAFPWVLAGAGGHPGQYAEVVMGLALVTDAAFTVLLYRVAASARSPAVWTWLLAVPLLGATTYARFDLVPGVLAGVAVLVLAGRPRVSAACAAVAAGAKLWPALLLPALAAPWRARRTVLTTAGLAGTVLVAVTLLAAGWDRLVSPLTWQTDRGLQIESVPATPVMLAWAADPGTWTVAYSASNAFEISGPGVSALLAVDRFLGALVAAALLLVWVLAWRAGRWLTSEAVVWACLAAVTGFVVSSKVLSPQYLLWLLPSAAAGLVVVGPARRLLTWVGLLLAATALTHLVFPVFYAGVTVHHDWSGRVVLLLALRNALLVGLCAAAFHQAVAQIRGATQRGSALERHPPGPDGNQVRILR